MLSTDREEFLKAVPLFADLSPGEIHQLAEDATFVEFPAGAVIVREGEVGDSAYIIVKGSVQVYTIDRSGGEIVLNLLEQGACFGEQSLLPGRSGRRNASVRAAGDVSLLKILKAQFQRVLSDHNTLKEHLVRLGDEQVRQNMERVSSLFRLLRVGDTGAHHREAMYSDGEVVFREGDQPDNCYVILSGGAGVYKMSDGTPTLLTRLRPGQCFGEAGLIRRAPRAATVIAEGELRVTAIEGRKFLEMYESNPELRQFAESLQKVYLLPRRGIITQYLGKFLDHDCISTTYHLFDGRQATVSQVVDQQILSLTVSDYKGAAITEGVETLRYEDAAQDLQRELRIAGGKLVGMTVRGPWAEFGKLLERALDDVEFHSWEGAVFVQKGDLQMEEQAVFFQDSEIVCTCLQVRRGALRQAIEQGQETAESLSKATGAGTVCGSCMVNLRGMLGRPDWTPVRILEMKDFLDDIRAFRFEPCSGAVKQSHPGQHIVIQGQIEGKWVQRAYTLSSCCQETAHYEITVKREPHGQFSQWLFHQRPENAMIQISSPQGHYHFDMEQDKRPVVCMVGGIGVTPAIAMCRSFLREGNERRLHIDYSAPTPDRLAYDQEFLAAAERCPNVTVTLRATRRDGHIKQADADQINRDLPGAIYFLCGPDKFLNGIKAVLLAAGVPDERIMIETFTQAGVPAAAPAADGAAATQTPVDVGPPPGYGMVDEAEKLSPLDEARIYLQWFYREKGVPEAFEPRWQAVQKQVRETGTYVQTFDELSYGCKVSWRNSTRCIGRLFWQGLNVRDLRNLTTEEELFDAIVEHVKLATNNGNLRATISVFSPGTPDAWAFRLWNPLILRYAGYRQPDGSILGDPANVDFTDQCMKYGWKGGPGTMFDVLPILIQRAGRPPKLFELPPEIILEVPIEHPRFKWFPELGLKWFALPMVCDMLLDLGGIRYTCAPFNGFYMGTEIGARNFCDESRYNLVPRIAARMGIDTRNDRTLWKDRVLIEMNEAVLYSYEKRGVKMTDHHRAAQDFLRFVDAEKGKGRPINADWSYLIPPISASSVPVFHIAWKNAQLKPNLFYQKKAWLT